METCLRTEMLEHLDRLARPVLTLGANGQLREKLTIEEKKGANRTPYTYWELVGRLLCGMAPWFELNPATLSPEERALQTEFLDMAHKTIQGQVDRNSPDHTAFQTYAKDYSQIIVDSAFLSQAFLRSPRRLWGELDEKAQDWTGDVFRQVRQLRSYESNWLLFNGEIEAALSALQGESQPGTVRYCFQRFEEWYVGDGWYSDGKNFALDYYNSLVIQPMLLDIAKAFPWELPPGWRTTYLERAQRHARHLERMIFPDGTYLIIGRSLAYRCGVFHLLAQLALEESLPKEISYGRAREALCSIIRTSLSPSSYNEQGILTIGITDSQPSFGENYISTGSLYLCSTAFLPLGLAPDHAFWTSPGEPGTHEKTWNGVDVPNVSPR